MGGAAAVERAGGGAERRPANSAEAASLGNVADVVRFLAFGDNPARIYPVRPQFISSSVPYATTLEAAMWSRSLEVVKLLDERGAIVGDGSRHALACLAADLDLPDIVAYLAGSTAPACEPGAALRRVTARGAAEGEAAR
jgi:hypothetical protein